MSAPPASSVPDPGRGRAVHRGVRRDAFRRRDGGSEDPAAQPAGQRLCRTPGAHSMSRATDRMLIAGPRHRHAVLGEHTAHYTSTGRTGPGACDQQAPPRARACPNRAARMPTATVRRRAPPPCPIPGARTTPAATDLTAGCVTHRARPDYSDRTDHGDCRRVDIACSDDDVAEKAVSSCLDLPVGGIVSGYSE